MLASVKLSWWGSMTRPARRFKKSPTIIRAKQTSEVSEEFGSLKASTAHRNFASVRCDALRGG